MIYQSLDAELKLLAATPGVIACVLVSADTGMVYLSSSTNPEIEAISEAARDYWALHKKNGKVFETLGSVRIVFVQHARSILAVQSFGKETLLLVTITTVQHVDWKKWTEKTKGLRKLLLQLDSA